MTDSMRLAYACTSEEVAQAKSLLLRQQPGGGSKTRMWIVLLVIFCALVCAFYVQIPKDERLVWGGIFLVIWIVTFTLMKVRSKVTPPPVTIEIATGGLRVIDSKADVRVPWADFKRLIESETLFVLVGRDRVTAFSIPKRVFLDEASRDWFKSVAETGMNPAPGQV